MLGSRHLSKSTSNDFGLAANDALDPNGNRSALATRAARPIVFLVLPCEVIIGPPTLWRANGVVWWVA